jgi:hypothetical protein
MLNGSINSSKAVKILREAIYGPQLPNISLLHIIFHKLFTKQ